MVEELKRNTDENNKKNNEIENHESENEYTEDDMNEEMEMFCEDVDSKCVLSHICYKYSSMVVSGLIEALDYFAGNQGSKVLRRILAKSIPLQMMDALGINAQHLKDVDEEGIIKLLPELINKKGGPNIKIEKLDNGEYRFMLNECHFLPYSKTKGFCNVTAGLMLGLAQLLSKKSMDIEEIQTIAHGGVQCEFIARPKNF